MKNAYDYVPARKVHAITGTPTEHFTLRVRITHLSSIQIAPSLLVDDVERFLNVTSRKHVEVAKIQEADFEGVLWA